MPVEILTTCQRTEWERFPEEIDEGALAAFFCFADDELEAIAAHRSVYRCFAIAVAAGALRWLGFVPAALDELPVAAAGLIASQLDLELSSIAPARLNVERGARAEHRAHAMAISRFRACGDEDLDALRSSVGDRALGHDGPLALMRHAVNCLRRERLVRPGLTVIERPVASRRSTAASGRSSHRAWLPRSTSCSSSRRVRRPRRSRRSVRRRGRSRGSASRSTEPRAARPSVPASHPRTCSNVRLAVVAPWCMRRNSSHG
jgi:hypothetical protein